MNNICAPLTSNGAAQSNCDKYSCSSFIYCRGLCLKIWQKVINLLRWSHKNVKELKHFVNCCWNTFRIYLTILWNQVLGLSLQSPKCLIPKNSVIRNQVLGLSLQSPKSLMPKKRVIRSDFAQHPTIVKLLDLVIFDNFLGIHLLSVSPFIEPSWRILYCVANLA